LLLDPAAVLLLLAATQQSTFVAACPDAVQQANKMRIRKYPDVDI
jgi:hypothetical protein